MPKSRPRKGRKPYRPRAVAPSEWMPDPSGVPSSAPTSSRRDLDPRNARRPRDQGDVELSGDVATFQRRIIGSEAWRRRVEDEVVLLVNAERRRHGLPALRIDEQLRRSARGHSIDMRARGYFAHCSPDGGTPSDRMRASGYRAPAAENIARGQPDPGAVVHAWMLSPGHRVNMLHPQVRAIGVGLLDASGGPWWTQHFGYE